MDTNFYQKMMEFRTEMEHLKTYIQSGSYPKSMNEVEKRKVRYRAKNHRLNDDGDLVYKGKDGSCAVLVITHAEKVKEILRHYHEDPVGGHSGIGNTVAKIAERYFWPNITADVTLFIRTCQACQHYEKLKTQAPVLQSIKVHAPLDLVGMDLIGPLPKTAADHLYVLSMTDYFTKFVELFPLKKKDAESVAKCIKQFVLRWGAPKRLLSDQGREFCNKMNTELCKKLNIERSVTAAYHPQTNGLDERTNQTVKTRLGKLTSDEGSNWDEFLEEVAFSIRSQKQASTRFSPFFLMFGRKPRMPLEMEEAKEKLPLDLDVDEDTLQSYVDQKLSQTAEVFQKVSDNQDRAHERQKETYAKRMAKGVKTFTFRHGDMVLRRNNKNSGRKGGALEQKWIGPYMVMDIDNRKRVLLAKGNGEDQQLLKTRVAYDQLKPVLTSSLHQGQDAGEEEWDVRDDGLAPCDYDDAEDHEVSITSNDVDPVPLNDAFAEEVTGKADHEVTITSIDVDPVPLNDAFAEEVTGKAVYPGLSAFTMNQNLKECDSGPKAAQPVPLDDVKTEEVTARAALKKRVLKSVSAQPVPLDDVKTEEVTARAPAKRRRKESPLDMDDILFAGRSGPTRRNAEPLPVQPAYECSTASLMLGMMKVLRKDWELTDEHMDHASFLLKKQFPVVDGLQRMSVFESAGCQKVGTPRDRFVQVLLVGSHWLTVSNMLSKAPGEIFIYDSMFSKTPKSYRKKFISQLGWLLFTQSEEIVMLWPDCSKQRGNKDCGLYALANAVALCEGVRPEDHDWEQATMRDHLSSCFRRGEMSSFPSVPRVSAGVGHREAERVYCHCRQPETGRFMAECASCSEWYHKGCEKVPNTVTADTHFVCKKCSTP